ncbi:hypothetical protein SUDANB96_06588 [Streptomyces sp. enrichment culture]
MRVFSRCLAAAVPLILAPLAAAPGASAQSQERTVPVAVTKTSGIPIPNSYIVTLEKGTDAAAFVSKVPLLGRPPSPTAACCPGSRRR